MQSIEATDFSVRAVLTENVELAAAACVFLGSSTIIWRHSDVDGGRKNYSSYQLVLCLQGACSRCLCVCPHWHVNIPSYFSVNIIYCLDWLHLPSTLSGYPHITWRTVPFKVCHSEEFGGILLYSTLLLLIEKCSRLRVHHWNKTGNHSPLNKIINAHSLDILTNLTSDPEHS